jgi:hypothetical protein
MTGKVDCERHGRSETLDFPTPRRETTKVDHDTTSGMMHMYIHLKLLNILDIFWKQLLFSASLAVAAHSMFMLNMWARSARFRWNESPPKTANKGIHVTFSINDDRNFSRRADGEEPPERCCRRRRTLRPSLGRLAMIPCRIYPVGKQTIKYGKVEVTAIPQRRLALARHLVSLVFTPHY